MTRWLIKTSKGKRQLGTFYGTKKQAQSWARRKWKIKVKIVSGGQK